MMVLGPLTAKGQSITVSSFRLLESDLTAIMSGSSEVDQNGETAALIKVVTNQTGFVFDVGVLGIVKVKQTPGEILLYLPFGSKKITIKHPQLGVLRDYYFNMPLESGRTYEMVLNTGMVQTIVQQARTSQYVVFQVTPPNAIVELDGMVLSTEDGTASKMMKFGTYDYRVMAPNYTPATGRITVNDPQNKHIVNVDLKPNLTKVIVRVDNDAEIWVNREKKGTGSWTGEIGEGTYEFEAKKAGFRSTIFTKDISFSAEPQVIRLQSPTPIFGDADINSSPAMADVFIDDKAVGKTPLLMSQLSIGDHQIKITKQGYEPYVSTMTIKENTTAQLMTKLTKTAVAEKPKEKVKEKQKAEKQAEAKATVKEKVTEKPKVVEINAKDSASHYNGLVDHALKKVQKELDIMARNMVRAQVGEATLPYDTIGLGDAICEATNAALTCYKYDIMPNKKGKVSPRYMEVNAKRIWQLRPNLVDLGQDVARLGRNTYALKYWGKFLDTVDEPLFATMDKNAERSYFGQVAYLAGRQAFSANDMVRANRYFEMAKKDPTQKEKAQNFMLYALRNNMKTHADTLNYLAFLKQAYTTEPENEHVLNALNGLYEKMDKKEQVNFLEEHIKRFPNSFNALTYRGMIAFNANKPEEAANWLRKATYAKSDNAQVFTYLGICLSAQAANVEDSTKSKDLFRQAVEAFDKAKEIDPNKRKVNWGYNRYQAYYGLYGADDPKTKAAEADLR